MTTVDHRPRCEVRVKRADLTTWGTEEGIVYRPEPCGRLAKFTTRVGNRDVATCGVHRIREFGR